MLFIEFYFFFLRMSYLPFDFGKDSICPQIVLKVLFLEVTFLMEANKLAFPPGLFSNLHMISRYNALQEVFNLSR